MPRARVNVIDVMLEGTKSKAEAEEKLGLLKKNADDISMSLDEIDAELDDDSTAAEEEDDEASSDDEGDAEAKVARHKAKWQKRMEKYRKHASKGKVEKLQKANVKQQAKLEKVCVKSREGAARQAISTPAWPPMLHTPSAAFVHDLVPTPAARVCVSHVSLVRPRTRASPMFTSLTSRQR